MSRLRGAAALVAILLAGGASAYVRSTATPGTGAPLFWKNPHVTFVTNSGLFKSVPGCTTGAAAMALARQSIPTWNKATRAGESQPCTSFNFVDGGDTTRTDLGYDQTPGAVNVNLIVFRSGLCSAITDSICRATDQSACVAKYNCWEHDTAPGSGTIALTSITYDTQTGEIFDADMELHDWNGLTSTPTGWYFTCAASGPTCGCPASNPSCAGPGAPYGQSGCVYMDVGNTTTHEAGHMLGLDHTCVTSSTEGAGDCPAGGSVMAPTAAPGDTDKRILRADDVAGVCTIYPAQTSNPSSGGGCGQGTLTATGAALLAVFALGWRRRRAPRA